MMTLSHEKTMLKNSNMPLTTAPILIGNGTWIAADVYVAPGVSIGEGAVVGVRSSVFKDIAPWTVVAGTPAKFIKKRELCHEDRTHAC